MSHMGSRYQTTIRIRWFKSWSYCEYLKLRIDWNRLWHELSIVWFEHITYSWDSVWAAAGIRVVAPFSMVTWPQACLPEQSHWSDMRLSGVRECFHFDSSEMLAWTRTRMSCCIYISFSRCRIQSWGWPWLPLWHNHNFSLSHAIYDK